jgi:hypothetical protein
MTHTAHFSVAIPSGTNLTYRLYNQVILHGELAAHISHFSDIDALTRALIAVGLPDSIATGQLRGSTHEVTGQQLRDLGFPFEDSSL